MSYRPQVQETCPECKVAFTCSERRHPDGRPGVWKCCPTGHWTRTFQLREARRVKKDPEVRPRAPRIEDDISISLAMVIANCDRLISMFPSGSLYRNMAEGIFGNSLAVAKDALTRREPA